MDNVAGGRVRLILAIYVALNIGLCLAWGLPDPSKQNDFKLWRELPNAIIDGTIYGYRVPRFVWSPPAAVLMAGVAFMGYWAWFALHYVSLLLLWRTPLIIGLAAVSWPLWVDAREGNVFTFVFVTGVLALQGSRAGALAVIALTVLIPRPVQLPLVAWLLWKRPDLRYPAAGMAAVVGIVSIPLLPEWVAAVRGQVNMFNLSPSRFIGPAWYAIGIPLGAWLTWKGRVGWAGLAMSPYNLPYYLLVLFWELVPRARVTLFNVDHRRPSPKSKTGQRVIGAGPDDG